MNGSRGGAGTGGPGRRLMGKHRQDVWVRIRGLVQKGSRGTGVLSWWLGVKCGRLGN